MTWAETLTAITIGLTAITVIATPYIAYRFKKLELKNPAALDEAKFKVEILTKLNDAAKARGDVLPGYEEQLKEIMAFNKPKVASENKRSFWRYSKWNLFGLLMSIMLLLSEIVSEKPLTRISVFFICYGTGLVLVNGLILLSIYFVWRLDRD